MKTFLRLWIALLSLAALGLAAVWARAMPFPTAPVSGGSSIAKVAAGCGPGWRPGPYGFHGFGNWRPARACV